MLAEVRENLKVTWIFLLTRFAVSLVVGLFYILLAAALQYFYVSLLGETKFNYIIGGVLSLFVGSIACTYLGKLGFMFVRGWHMAALAYRSQILKKNLPPLEAGMTVFRKHFSSFAVVYGAQFFILKVARKGADQLWELLKDVPFLGSLQRFAENPIVSKIANDLLDTAFDATMYYIVRYTKPGLGDNLQAVPSALKRYLYALPQVMLTSFSGYLLFYSIPKILRTAVMLGLLFTNGLVAGVLQCVLVYPLYYIIEHAFFEPLESVLLISCYSKHCTDELEEDEQSLYKSIVDSILESSGLSDAFTAGEAKPKKSKSTESSGGNENKGTCTPGSDAQEFIDVEPDIEDGEVAIGSTLNSAPTASLSSFMEKPLDSVGELPLSDEDTTTEILPSSMNRLTPPGLEDTVPIAESEVIRGSGAISSLAELTGMFARQSQQTSQQTVAERLAALSGVDPSLLSDSTSSADRAASVLGGGSEDEFT